MKYPGVQNYINGEFVNSSSKRSLDIISPVDGNHLSSVPLSTAKDLDDAVKAVLGAVGVPVDEAPGPAVVIVQAVNGHGEIAGAEPLHE